MKYSTENQHIYKLTSHKKKLMFFSEFDTLLMFLDLQKKKSHFFRNKHVLKKKKNFAQHDFITEVNISPIFTFSMPKIDIFAPNLI